MMQQLPLDKLVQVAVNEVLDKRRICAIGFAVISIAIIAVGLKWPKSYESTTTLLRDQSSVVRPLLEGTAVTSHGSVYSEIAREVIYSSNNLDSIIESAGLNVDALGNPKSDLEIELLKASLRGQIQIQRSSDNIIKITYRNQDPNKAFLVVSNASRLFIEETTEKQKAGSNEAYAFIENQVQEYKRKLDDINARINQFKAENIEIQVDTSQGLNNQISQMRDRIRQTSLALKEANIQRESLLEQLRIESQKTKAEQVVNVQQQRLIELENQLSTLRLTYTDTYPDVVQLIDQIELLKQSMRESSAGDGSGDTTTATQTRSDLYAILSRQLADQETQIRTLEARKAEQESNFDQLIGKSSKVNQLVSKLEELSRDREVTQQIHDQLLTRRENARVSLSLEMESARSLFKVQEPPTIPIVPEGLRFLHFLVASIVLGIGIPVGIVVGLMLIDPRIRHEDGLDLGDGIPVFGSIPTFRTVREARGQKWVTAQTVLVLIVSIATIVTLSVSRSLGTV